MKYDPLAEEIEVNLIEDDETREETETIGYYAMFEYQNGFRKTMYWSKKKMLAHANKYSQAFNAESYKNIQDGKVSQNDLWKYSSFWYKDFDGMSYKTMLRQLISKWGIMSIEMQEAYTKDMATIKENGDYEYIENDQTLYEESIQVESNINEEQKVTTEKETTKKAEKVKKEETVKEEVEEETPNIQPVAEPEQKQEEPPIESNETNNTDDDFFGD
nr:recombinase RecT [Romboutsia ilealis]